MLRAIATFLLCTTLCAGATALPITLKFRVTDDANNVLKGMTVRLYEQNEVVEEIENAKSLVSFELSEPTIYTIEVVLKGFVTKRITVVTNLIENQLDDDVFRFQVRLERSSDYRGISGSEDVLEFPSAIVDYDTNSGLFDYNETYFLSTEKAFQELYEKHKEIKF